MSCHVYLAVTAAPDVETARQLDDYVTLDAAGVVAALEQTGLQRDSARRWPGYLARLQQVAVVIDAAGELTLATFEAATLAQEYSLLESLFAVLPDMPEGRCVAWQDGDWQLLWQRAYRHQLPAPALVHGWPRLSLSELFAESAVSSDLVRLYGAEFATADAIEPALRNAVHWYVMDLRRRCVSGDLERDAARECAARAVARAVQTADGTTS